MNGYDVTDFLSDISIYLKQETLFALSSMRRKYSGLILNLRCITSEKVSGIKDISKYKPLYMNLKWNKKPINISGLTTLTDLNLGDCNASVDIRTLTNLTKLNLNNYIFYDVIPLNTLTNLTWLKMPNQYHVMDISSLYCLTYLDASGTDIKTVDNLTSLKTFKFNHSSVNFDIRKLTTLTNLSLKFSYYDFSDILFLTNLTKLNLEGDTELKDRLHRFTNLKTLILGRSENHPQNITVLTNLETLRITSKDTGFKDLSSLVKLTNLILMSKDQKKNIVLPHSLNIWYHSTY